MTDFMTILRQAALQGLRRELNEAWQRAHAAEQEATALRALLAEATDSLEQMTDAVQWMSGSNDFGPEGQAFEGWIKVRGQLNLAIATLMRSQQAISKEPR